MRGDGITSHTMVLFLFMEGYFIVLLFSILLGYIVWSVRFYVCMYIYIYIYIIYIYTYIYIYISIIIFVTEVFERHPGEDFP